MNNVKPGLDYTLPSYRVVRCTGIVRDNETLGDVVGCYYADVPRRAYMFFSLEWWQRNAVPVTRTFVGQV